MSMTQSRKDLMSTWAKSWGKSKCGVILSKKRQAKLKDCTLNELKYFRAVAKNNITKGSSRVLNSMIADKSMIGAVKYSAINLPNTTSKNTRSQKLQVAIAALKAINSPESIIALQIIDEVE